MKTVQIQSKYESSEHNLDIFYDEEKHELRGKKEYTYYGKEKQHVIRDFIITNDEIKVNDHFDDSITDYIIRMPKLYLILDYDIFEKITSAIDKIFDELKNAGNADNIKVTYAKNLRKLESEKIYVEIAEKNMIIKTKDLEINDLKFDYLDFEVSSTDNLINDDIDFGPEVYTSDEAKDGISLINIRIHRILEPLLFLQAELRCVFYWGEWDGRKSRSRDPSQNRGVHKK